MVVLETVREKMGHKRIFFYWSYTGFIGRRNACKVFDELPVTEKPVIDEARKGFRAACDWHDSCIVPVEWMDMHVCV